jgi:hypothetical protein
MNVDIARLGHGTGNLLNCDQDEQDTPDTPQEACRYEYSDVNPIQQRTGVKGGSPEIGDVRSLLSMCGVVNNRLCSMATLNGALHEDLKSAATCTFSSMLTHLLKKCCVDDPQDDVLQRCLAAVLPLCHDAQIRDDLTT